MSQTDETAAANAAEEKKVSEAAAKKAEEEKQKADKATKKKADDKDEAKKKAEDEAKSKTTKPKIVRVICEGTVGPELLKKGDITDNPEYVALLGTKRGKRLVEEVK